MNNHVRARTDSRPSRPARRALLCCAVLLSLAAPAGAMAAETTMIKLIKGLMATGALKPEDGQALLVQAEAEAAAAQRGAAGAASASSGGIALEAGDVRVPYVPQSVRDGIRDEVRQDVMAQAKAEGWAAPNEVAEWTQRIKVTGDVRVRSESRFHGDDNSGIVSNWAAVNAGSGFDTNTNTNLQLPPLLNTRQDRRNLWRIRARLGVEAMIGDHTTAGIRLASGSSNGPVSTTEQLGGGLSKKDVWLDQAWLAYSPADWVTVRGGRFGNPFWSSDTLFSNDLNFDGLAANLKYGFGDGDLDLFGTLAVAPLEYTSDSLQSRSGEKSPNENKWLSGAQAGVNWRFNDDNALRAALGYYDFKNISGRLSSPCALYSGAVGCDTDWSRPAFMQKGNTLMLIRDIALNPMDPAGTPTPQYVGLASAFRLATLNLRWDTRLAQDIGLRLEGDFIRNLAYDTQAMFRRANNGIVNNFGAGDAPGIDTFRSGDTAWMLQATFGATDLKEKGQWQALLGYKRIEADALPDAYNDPNFHLGGTNARGYYVGGAYALDARSWISGKWMAAKAVSGPPLAIDVFQLEFNTGF
ncbi:TPA: putative porin [Stenotrophomonas maltophilia]|uniref:putative porin n=1 Tax=Stenotrophomonas TaxID=40323 RepID=UPI0013DD3D76|nr:MULTISPECIES: putative porin [Stenotrophomonas]MDH2021491.1 putative porin [Stenotrophomonas sp. GD03680]HEL3749447.1 putative porin [Stenotrophomonas maltophilia]HEL7728265.1 putative porin [Stenotrophomonas maltophilia]